MSSGTRLRPSVLAAREHLADGRSQLRQLHDRGLDGVQVCARLTSLLDTAIFRLFGAMLDEMPEAKASEVRQRVTLVAHGGYGRREQAPYSDVDLMFLYDGRLDPLMTEVARRLTQDIFDIGVQLGQSVRTVNQAIQMAGSDPQIGTSLIESRRLVGSEELYDRFSAALSTMLQRRSAGLSREFVAARFEERQRFGETVYLLEPNVKRSRGGLRDMHLLRWLWFLKCGVSDPDRLHNMGVISKFDYRRLLSAKKFLLRIRNEMHFFFSEPNDALTRAEQLRLTEYFDVRGRTGMLPVEQFMRDYFHHTNHIWHLAHRLSELMQPASRVSRVFAPIFERTTGDDYQIGRREVSATAKSLARLKSHVEEVLRLVDMARVDGKWISQDTWYSIYRAAPNYPDEPTPDTVAAFLKILDNPVRLGELLRRLHELGVLEKIIPEYSHARSLLQFNQYHKYTVDEHCIRAVEEATRFAEREDHLGEVYRGIKNKWILHLVLLIHDLGKGYEEDHSDVGRRIASQTAKRLSLAPQNVDSLEYLVHRHLHMSHLAFRRDTTQVELVSRFAEEVSSQQRLDMFYVLSCADLAAVGPGVLNSWKIEMLAELYSRASRALSTDHLAIFQQRRDAKQKATLDSLPADQRSDPWFERQIEALPETFLSGRPPQDLAAVLQRMRNLSDGRGVAWSHYLPETKTVEFIAGVDHGAGRGIFSSMAGALSSRGMEILAAESNTLADGLLLLRYIAEDPDHANEPPTDRLEGITRGLEASIESDEPPVFRTVWGSDRNEANAQLTNLPCEVRIDSELSDTCTIVEVFTIDRRGLLYRLARELHDLQFVIHFAKISTYLDQVVDVFYVTERDQSKPVASERLDAIRQHLAPIIEPEENKQ